MVMKGVDQTARPALGRFKLVSRASKRTRGKANRDPQGVKVGRTGVGEANVAGTEVFDEQAQAEGLGLNSYGIVFGGDEEAQQIAAVLVDANTAGATPVRRDPRKHTLTLYMNDLFEECPKLRPSSTRWCTISREPDGADGHFILIALNLGLEPRSIRRTPSEKPARKQVAPAPTEG